MKKALIPLLPALLLSGCGSSSSSSALSSVTGPTISSTGSFEEDPLLENRPADRYGNYYEIFVSSYADSDGDGIGDLKGIESKLDAIKEMGFTGIWLTPIFESTSYHKYNVDDYFAIDPDFGTMDDLKDLIKACHSKDIKILLDLVVNHTGYNNEWFTKALLAHQKKVQNQTLTAEEKDYDSLYVFYDSWEEANASGKTYYQAGGNSFYYEANFSRDMPELNFESDFTYEKIQSVTDYYLDLGVDGFRMDAVIYYFLNETDRNVAALDRIAAFVHAKKEDSYLVAEAWVGESLYASYTASEIDSFFYFPASAAFQSSSYILSSSALDGLYKKTYLNGMKRMLENTKNGIPAVFLDNHDMPRVTQGRNRQATKFNLGLQLMSSGITFTYYGDEIGMSSSNNPGGDYADSNYRTHYYWDDTTHAMECDDAPNAAEQEEFYPAYQTQKEDENSILNYVTKANRIRNAFPAVARGTPETTAFDDEVNESSDSVLSFVKRYGDETIRFLVNFSSLESRDVKLEGDAVLSVLLADTTKEATYKDGTITLPPYAIALTRAN